MILQIKLNKVAAVMLGLFTLLHLECVNILLIT